MSRYSRGRRPKVEWGPSLTQQSLANECDVNVIVAKYLKTGDARIFNQRIAQWGDISDIGSYQECLQRNKEAAEAFATLPARIRDAYGNDPMRLADALGSPEERSKLIELGIIVPEPETPDSGQPAKPDTTSSPS